MALKADIRTEAKAIGRRRLLKTGVIAAGCIAAARVAQSVPAAAEPHEDASKTIGPFRHRGYLGWITDLATVPDAGASWPSMRLDERLLEDYGETFGLMRRLGFNEISIWGLYVSHAWPVDIKGSVTPPRAEKVERLVEAAHSHGIRVLAGLGVYSWGFDRIIQANPGLSRGNPSAMCASEPESWKWMQKVVDFVFERFDIDGVSMQSADQGRCRCGQCAVHSDAEYHALLNVRAAEYIRSNKSGKTVGVNSWGMRFGDPAALPALIRMSRHIDYLIDVHDTSRWGAPDYRKQLIRSLQCDFGTLGGPQVEPPQHWRRDRWFLPVLKRTGRHLGRLAADGGRACEYFFHILANPGDEISFHLAGRMLADPGTSWEKHLQKSIEQLYQVSDPPARDALAELFLRAEEAYFEHLSPDECGTISLEPLVSDRPGPPVYLTQRLEIRQRNEYEKEIRDIKAEFEALAAEIRDSGRIAAIVRCLQNVLDDLGTARQ